MSINERMIAIMTEIGAVKKDQTNEQQGWKFRGIEQFMNALHPLMAKHKVILRPSCAGVTSEIKSVTRSNGKLGNDKHVYVSMNYYFETLEGGGKSFHVGPIPGEGIDSGDKATAKALSAALKYMVQQVFMIPTEDMMDGDKESLEEPMGWSASDDPGTRYLEGLPPFDEDYAPTPIPPPMMDPRKEATKFAKNMTKNLPNTNLHKHIWKPSKYGKGDFCSCKLPDGSYCKETK